MKYFDYLFYRVARAYSKTISTSPIGMSWAIVSLMEFLSASIVFFSFQILFHHKVTVPKPILIISMILVMAFNRIRYFFRKRTNYEALDKKWINETKFLKVRNGVFATLYIILNLILAIGLAIYLGRFIK
jgi:uncharacterized membrane protein YbhN (UPF0104 family)